MMASPSSVVGMVLSPLLSDPAACSITLLCWISASGEGGECAAQTTLKPVIRLKGGEGNGTDLVLPAELTGDRRTLIASTPVEKSPYAAGSHEIHLSLNGQQFMAVNGSIFSSAQDMVHAAAIFAPVLHIKQLMLHACDALSYFA